MFDGITLGLDAVIVYHSGFIVPDSYSFSNMGQLFIDYIEDRIPILINGTYDFVDVKDVVTRIIKAAEKGITGNSFILSGYQITIKSYSPV